MFQCVYIAGLQGNPVTLHPKQLERLGSHRHSRRHPHRRGQSHSHQLLT